MDRAGSKNLLLGLGVQIFTGFCCLQNFRWTSEREERMRSPLALTYVMDPPAVTKDATGNQLKWVKMHARAFSISFWTLLTPRCSFSSGTGRTWPFFFPSAGKSVFQGLRGNPYFGNSWARKFAKKEVREIVGPKSHEPGLLLTGSADGEAHPPREDRNPSREHAAAGFYK